jgi:hypothetical protein
MSCTCTPARFEAPKCSFCLRVEILGPVFGLSFGPSARFVTEVRFACHVRAHQHVLRRRSAVSASEWKFWAQFLGSVLGP